MGLPKKLKDLLAGKRKVPRLSSILSSQPSFFPPLPTMSAAVNTMPASLPMLAPSPVAAAEARAALPHISYAQFRERLLDELGVEDATSVSIFRSDLLYIHYLISQGNLPAVQAFLGQQDDDTKRRLVNETDYNTHMGNTLHTCAYWNTGEDAVEMFDFLVSCGATPIRNYYGDLPWENYNGLLYVPILNLGGQESLHRAPAEFTATCATLESRYDDFVPAEECMPSIRSG
jgi:hypothetical protein